MVQFAIARPKTVIGVALIITILFGSQLPKITTDTDPKHMLPITSPVRQYNDQVEREFELHPDVLVLGVVNERGIVNKQTLTWISDLTSEIQRIPGVIVRSVLLIVANMAAAMISIIWSMGLLIGLGYPVHIMSSMSPVFLMAIATDTVHIFNEFFFRYREVGEKKSAVVDTMAAVGSPVLFSDLTTAAGFASLAITSIIPVRIFGLLVAFGTLVILLMSFTLVPAILILLREERLARVVGALPKKANDQPALADPSRFSLLSRIGEICVRRGKGIAILGCVLLVISAVGISRIRVNNNMVHWFKYFT